MKKKILFGVSILVILTATTAICQPHVPPSINFQGKITDTNGVPLGNLPGTNIDGQIDIVFRIYDSSNGVTAVWGQTNSDVYVERGLFSVLLTNLNNSVFPTNSAVCRWLEVEVRDWGATNILAPRKEIVSVPYAINADMVDGMHWWDIVVAATNEMKETDPTVVSWVKDGVRWDELKGVQGMPAGFADDVDNVGITVETDPTVVGWVKDGESWTELKGQGMPAGFADDVDNVGITAETDPTVVGWVKDGESWAELKGQGMPAGFADDVDNVGITEETDPQVGAIALNSVPRWDNEKLVTSSIYYDPGNDRVGIGTPSPGYKLDVNGDAVIRGPLYLSWGDDRIQAVGGDYQPFLALHATLYPYLLGVTTVLVPTPSGFMVANWQNTRPNMHLNNDGKLLVRDFEVISDDRIKFNEQTLDYGLAQVMALEPKRFDRAEWEVDPATEEIIVHPEQTANKIGLIAQEVRQVIPEAVSIPEDENRQLWSLSYDNIVPVLVKAIQEQQAQIEALKQENQALVARYAPLESERLTDTPLTADFDGDGKADRAMVDSDGNWYVWLSGSGYSQSRL